MRNANGSIDLWPIQFSDYAADMRKSNAHNGLCQSSILAIGRGAVRALRRRIAIDEMGRSRGKPIEDACQQRPARSWIRAFRRRTHRVPVPRTARTQGPFRQTLPDRQPMVIR
jgi:hypothetical protein